MKKYLDLIIEKFEEEGEVYYLATSKDVQGLVAQGDTVEETVEIARSLVIDITELREKKNREGKGSHEIWYNPKTDLFTVLPRHGSKDIKEGTLNATLKQAGINIDDFLNY